MNIYRFFNSKYIAEHLRSLNYQFTPLEIAAVVDMSRDATMDERFAAWQEIIDTMPDCEVKVTADSDADDTESLHELLKEYMEFEKKRIEIFYCDSDKAVYNYCILNEGSLEWREELQTFSDFKNCFSDVCHYKESIADDPDEIPIKAVRFRKMWLDRPDSCSGERYLVLEMNANLEITNFIYDRVTPDEESPRCPSMRSSYVFPLPFKRGDILIDPYDKDGEPFVFEGMYKNHSLTYAHGYSIDRENGVISCNDFLPPECMDFELYEGTFSDRNKENYRMLHAISGFLKGESDLSVLLNSYRLILHDGKSRELNWWFKMMYYLKNPLIQAILGDTEIKLDEHDKWWQEAVLKDKALKPNE